MPLSYSERRVSDAENRLRLLYCIEALGLVTQEQLWPFVARLELMTYVDMCLYLDDLIRDGSLVKGRQAAKGALCLTDGGLQALSLFKKRMPAADRAQIDQAAPAYASALAEKRQVKAVYELAAQGRSRAACSITEGDLPTLLIKLDTSREALAAAAVQRFAQRAPKLLTLLYTLPQSRQSVEIAKDTPLGDGLDAGRLLSAVAPDKPLLHAFSSREVAAAFLAANAETELRLLLMLPSRAMAQSWLNDAFPQRDALLKALCALLTEDDP